MSTNATTTSSDKPSTAVSEVKPIVNISGTDLVSSFVSNVTLMILLLGFGGPLLVMYPVVDKVVLQACQYVNSICAAMVTAETDTTPPEVQALPPQALADQLSSSYGINYRELQALLEQQNWEAANQKTTEIMALLFRQENLDIDTESPLLPALSKDFRSLNTLWTKYSDGHFGFARQSQIWQDIGGSAQATPEIYQGFAERVGWDDRNLSDLTFSLEAPPGHLPAAFVELLSLVEDDRLEKLTGFYRDRGVGYCSHWSLDSRGRWALWGDRSLFRGHLSMFRWNCGVKML
ncbi:MAG: hypothetical protein RLZZ435_3519 [Cyanobacteriota bacterium]